VQLQGVGIINARYFKGAGKPPAHLASINYEGAESGSLILTDTSGATYRQPFTSHAALLSLLGRLMHERVPFAVGGMCPGPADEVALLIEQGELEGDWVELSWSGAQEWMLREIRASTSEWEIQAAPDLIVNTSFDPGQFQRPSRT